MTPSVDAMACGSKSAYPSQRVAQGYARELKRNNDSRGKDRLVVNIYRCLACGTWHVGTSNPQYESVRPVARRRPRDRRIVVIQEEVA